MRRLALDTLQPLVRLDEDTLLLGDWPSQNGAHAQTLPALARGADGTRVVVVDVQPIFGLNPEQTADLLGEHLGARDTAAPSPALWPAAAGVVADDDAGAAPVVAVQRFDPPAGVGLGELLRAAALQERGLFPLGPALWIAEQVARSFHFHTDNRMNGAPDDFNDTVRVGYDGSVARALRVSELPEVDDDGPGILRGNLHSLDIDRVLGVPPRPESDSYRVARLLFTLLLGRDPFGAADGAPRSVIQTFERQVQLRHPALTEGRGDVPGDLCVFVEACLARHWADRPGPPDVVADALATFRSRFDDGGAETLAGLVAGWFPAERSADLRVAEDAALFDIDAADPGLRVIDYTRLDPRPPPPPGLGPMGNNAVEVQGAVRGRDGKAMVLVPPDLFVDATLVSNASWALFSQATGRLPLAHWGGPGPVPGTEDLPVVGVAPEDADAYAAFFGKRLPTQADWRRYGNSASTTTRSAPGFGILDLHRLWEWTAEPMPGREHGRVCRGGRYRDRSEDPGDATHESFDDDGAADIGFRCVVDAGASGLVPMGMPTRRPLFDPEDE